MGFRFMFILLTSTELLKEPSDHKEGAGSVEMLIHKTSDVTKHMVRVSNKTLQFKEVLYTTKYYAKG